MKKGVFVKFLLLIMLGFLTFQTIIYVLDEEEVVEEQEEIDFSKMNQSFIDYQSDAENPSTIELEEDNTFVLKFDNCTESIELSGTYVIDNYTTIALDFNNDENYNTYIGEDEITFTIDPVGVLIYNGKSLGCSPNGSNVMYGVYE